MFSSQSTLLFTGKFKKNIPKHLSIFKKLRNIPGCIPLPEPESKLYSGPTTFSIWVLWKCIQLYLCKPSDKPTTQRTAQHRWEQNFLGGGKNIILMVKAKTLEMGKAFSTIPSKPESPATLEVIMCFVCWHQKSVRVYSWQMFSFKHIMGFILLINRLRAGPDLNQFEWKC